MEMKMSAFRYPKEVKDALFHLYLSNAVYVQVDRNGMSVLIKITKKEARRLIKLYQLPLVGQIEFKVKPPINEIGDVFYQKDRLFLCFLGG